MDTGAWWVTVHGVTKSWTRLRDLAQTFCIQHCIIQLWVILYPGSAE